MTLSADGNHAYVTGNGDYAVSWYERNASTGVLTYGGVLQDGVDGVEGMGSIASQSHAPEKKIEGKDRMEEME